MTVDPITAGLAVAVGGDILIRIVSVIKKRADDSNPLKMAIDAVSLSNAKEFAALNATLKRMCAVQEEAAQDTRTIFHVLEGSLLAAQLTVKSIRGGDIDVDTLNEASAVIDEQLETYRKHLNSKIGKAATSCADVLTGGQV